MNAKAIHSDIVIPVITRSPSSNEVNLLSISSPPPISKLSFQTDEEEEEEYTVIPLTEQQFQQRYNKEAVIKQGLILCTRTEEWYTKKKTTMREVQLRKTRLRWRQFKAVLKPNRIELYHVTNLYITASSRLAHVIYLTNQYPYRRVKLSLLSAQDYIWCLQFLHYETKSLVSFHFQSSSLLESQEWYMAIYRILPPIPACKKPIPPFIDILVNAATKQQQQQQSSPTAVMIRIPLISLLIDEDDYKQWNIRAADLKPVIWTLFKKNGLADMLDTKSIDNIRLCWKSVINVINEYGEGASETAKAIALSSAAATLINGEDEDYIEWITEDTQLIGPQLIEQKHRLELRIVDPPPEKDKNKATATTYDGILIYKQRHRTKYHKFKRIPYYCILYGHHLFFLDQAYYQYYKRIKEQKRPIAALLNSTKQHSRRWFSATTGGIPLEQQQDRKNIWMNNKAQWQHINHSTPHITPQNTTVCDSTPDPLTLLNTKFAIDLNTVSKIQPHGQGDSSFEIYLKDGTALRYEAENTQIMLQWLTLITNKLKLDPPGLDNLKTYQSQPENVKYILQSGLLYVKQDFKKHFTQQYCILTKDDQNNGGLMMFDTIKYKKQWWRQFDCSSSANLQRREHLPIFEKRRQLSNLHTSYVYSGDECIADKLIVDTNSSKKEPLRLYNDGVVTGGSKTSDCVFVIWQIAKRHIVPNIREYISLFKLGHRLGNRGSCWVFKARSKKERDEWVWALHKEFSVMEL